MKAIMKAIVILLCVGLATSVTAGSIWGKAKSSPESISVLSEHPTGPRNGFDVNLTDRFFELVHDPSYVQAVAELVELQKKSTCSRQATLDFMDLCKNHEKYPGYTAKASEQQMEVLEESYAISLAICELKKGGIAFPSECVHFDTGRTSSRGTNQINQDQLQGCIKSLNKDGTHWTSFSNSLEKATVIRQAARVSVEKDQLIEIFKKGSVVYDETIARQVQAVTYFTSHLDLALANLAKGIEAHEAEMQSFMSRLQGKFSSFMENVNGDVSEIKTSVMENLRTVMEGMDKVTSTAEFHAQQMEETGAQMRESQQNLVTGAQKGLETVLGLRDVLFLVEFRFDAINANMELIQHRQNVMDQRSAEALVMIANLTEHLEAAASLGNAHLEVLEKAVQASLVLLNHIEGATKSIVSWSRRMLDPSGAFGFSPVFLITCPFMTLGVGSYGLKASITRNLALGGVGIGLAKVLTILNNPTFHFRLPDSLAIFAKEYQVGPEVVSVETQPAYPEDTDLDELEV